MISPTTLKERLLRYIAFVAAIVMAIIWLAILTSPEKPQERCFEDISYWHCGDAKTPR
jgi:hypothetical protein